MRFVKTMALCAFVVSALVACAANTGPQSAVQGVQRVGVISAIGDQLQYRQIASVALGNETKAAAISDWGFDSYIEGVIAQNLGQQYVVEGVQVDRTQPTAAALALAAGASKIGAPLDAYVVVVPVERPHYLAEKTTTTAANAGGMLGGAVGVLVAAAVAGDQGTYKGLGIYRASDDRARYVYAIADVVLIDGRTFTELRRTPLYSTDARAQATHIDGSTHYRDMRLLNSADRWPNDFSQFSKQHLQEISDELAILLRSQVGYSLRQLGMTY